MIEIIINLLTAVISILPMSPFKSFIDKASAISGLGILNWFIPFDIFKDILLIWGGCMGAYYLYRFIKSGGMKNN